MHLRTGSPILQLGPLRQSHLLGASLQRNLATGQGPILACTSSDWKNTSFSVSLLLARKPFRGLWKQSAAVGPGLQTVQKLHRGQTGAGEISEPASSTVKLLFCTRCSGHNTCVILSFLSADCPAGVLSVFPTKWVPLPRSSPDSITLP